MRHGLKVSGSSDILHAMERGLHFTRILVLRNATSESTRSLISRASELGIDVIEGSENDLRRMGDSSFDSAPSEALGLLNRDPSADLEDIMGLAGSIWLLAGAQYPVNIGYAIRTVEVSGGSAVFVDSELNSDGRKASSRASMKADRFIPVRWMGWEQAMDLAKRYGYRVIGIEDSGDVEPWDADLTGPCMLIIGGERHGIPDELLAQCDVVLRIPMGGFLPSYNLQAPLAVVATEVLRQNRGNS